jgi:uncharacterized protein YyaL (SSP411 family)
MEKKPNRLINEKSPYLLQHAYNPVDWYPWGDDAFEKAKAEDKLIFLSIGYSSCHWCHVMEKECFDDEEVAKLMNETFVSVKVDREERPDLDGAYMQVCQMMGRSCGWPLNIIMTPNRNPFFAASFIPKDNRFGMTGILSLIPQISEAWKTRRSELETIGQNIMERMENFGKRTSETELGKDVMDDAFEKLFLNFDEENGGFGNAPKFPSPHNLLFLLRYWKRNNEKNALMMVEKTLQAMRLGGIFDQVGFGFHRYSTDARWLVPHFEKMLYDQALLALAYAEAYQATGAGKFKITVKEVLEYVLRDLASQEGGFYSAEDADSEGQEGKFYLWTEEEIRKTLPPEDANFAVRVYGVEAAGNYDEPGHGRNGENILHFVKPLEQTAAELQSTQDELIPKLGRIQRALFEARQKRVRPAKDDKILTDWNGLMIAALAKATQVLGEDRYLQAAVKAADFILEMMRDKNGTLYHRYAKSEKAVSGFMDDHAFFVWGLIEIYEASFDRKYLQAASELTKTTIASLWDENNGGFFFTAKEAEETGLRRMEIYDGAYPSGNSVEFLNLLRLGRLTGDSAYEELASRMSKLFSAEVTGSPAAHTFMLLAVDFALGPTYNVILVGDLRENDTQEMLRVLRKNYLPNMIVSLRSPAQADSRIPGLGYEQIEGKATAYVCRNQTCMPATNKTEKVLELLGLSGTTDQA